jgi:hypothetical protein
MPFSKDPIFKCYKCNEPLRFEVKIGRRDTCPNCYAYLHCCKNCKHWDPSVHNECLEERSEFIRDREEGNFCLYFTFREVAGEDAVNEANDAKKKLEQMFGVSMKTAIKAPSTADEAKKKLEKLFKK